MNGKIEILSTTLLEDHRPLVEQLRATAARLGLEFGWHYLLDLTWIVSQLDSPAGQAILDAGAGVGVLQWYLAEQGVQVTSVDRGSRADLPMRFRTRFAVRGLRPQDLHPAGRLLQEQVLQGQFRSLVSSLGNWLANPLHRRAPGEVLVYNQDLSRLVDLQSDSYAAVVAVSALEHNPPEDLGAVVQELMRVLKPGGLLLATLGAARERDWYHEPSQGWCYTADTLRRLFDLPADTPDNYDRYDAYFSALRNSAELRDNLAGFYQRSGKNGMPWGKWDPQYQPVGVRKVKEQANDQ
jgi:SAM-dependent methyltransferase